MNFSIGGLLSATKSLIPAASIQTKLIIVGAMMATLFAAVAGFWLNYHHLQEAYAAAAAGTANAKAALAVEQATSTGLLKRIDTLQTRIEQAEELNRQLDAVYQRNRKDLTTIQHKLSKHDFERLSDAHPKLIENAINRGTAAAWRLLQCAGNPAPECSGGAKAGSNHSSAAGKATGPSAAPKIWVVITINKHAAYCISPRTYGVFAVGLAEVTRYINDTRVELSYYRNMK